MATNKQIDELIMKLSGETQDKNLLSYDFLKHDQEYYDYYTRFWRGRWDSPSLRELTFHPQPLGHLPLNVPSLSQLPHYAPPRVSGPGKVCHSNRTDIDYVKVALYDLFIFVFMI